MREIVCSPCKYNEHGTPLNDNIIQASSSRGIAFSYRCDLDGNAQIQCTRCKIYYCKDDMQTLQEEFHDYKKQAFFGHIHGSDGLLSPTVYWQEFHRVALSLSCLETFHALGTFQMALLVSFPVRLHLLPTLL